MIFITGDCHGEFQKFSTPAFPEYREMVKDDKLTMYFEDLAQRLTFINCFFGHYHDDRKIMCRFILLYDQIVRIR